MGLSKEDLEIKEVLDINPSDIKDAVIKSSVLSLARIIRDLRSTRDMLLLWLKSGRWQQEEYALTFHNAFSSIAQLSDAERKSITELRRWVESDLLNTRAARKALDDLTAELRIQTLKIKDKLEITKEVQ